jgi:hypothetical protein
MIRRLLAVAFALALTGTAQAQSLKAPTGPVIVTVTGAISHTNRGPFDENADIFFKNQQINFQRAAAFDLAMLEALGQRTVETDYPQGGPLHKFEGPLLRDVLKAAGADGRVVKVLAVDGYNQEIEMREIEQWPILLAVKQDGVYLAMGGFGPTRIIFPRRDVPALADRNDDKWVWAAVHIAVE